MRLMSGGQAPGARRSPHRAVVDEDGSLRLALDSGEERLPWLEGEEEDEEPGLDRGRVLAVGLALLLILLVLAGAAWWLWSGRGGPELVPDGSVIQAAEGPYKVRPRNPGGTEVAGTGDKSFEVAEGRQIEGRIAGSAPPAAPVAGALPTGEDAGGAVPGIGVQIGAYPTREAAQAAWAQLSARLPPLNGRGHRILEGTADSGPIYRLQAVAGSTAEAQALCSAVEQAGGDCQVKR